jgi:hypothetical protein
MGGLGCVWAVQSTQGGLRSCVWAVQSTQGSGGVENNVSSFKYVGGLAKGQPLAMQKFVPG